MHETAQNVLSLFRKIGPELSTSQILRNINPEYLKLEETINDLESKRKMAQMHRRILHHLNKFVDNGILRVNRHGERGEKFFSLGIKEDEEIIEISSSLKKRRIISRPLMPSMPIEGYEGKDIIIKYEPATWIDRLNSVVIFGDKVQSKDELLRVLEENVFPVINDVVNIEDFESVLNRFDVSDILERLNTECEDYGKTVSFTIDLSKIRNPENLNSLVETVSAKKLEFISVIFSLDIYEVEKHREMLAGVINTFSSQGRDFYVKNKEVHKAPYFVGKAGPYSFSEKEWKISESLKEKMFCIGCSQCGVVVDVHKFQQDYGMDLEKFSQLMFNISKSMLYANSVQRRRSNDCFRTVNSLNKEYGTDFLSLSRNYIRFWNFGLHQRGMDPEFVLNMINEAKKKINEFAAAEETIYKSCGMTTRFRLALSPAFLGAGKLSPSQYEHLKIDGLSDLSREEIKERLGEREAASDIFNGGDEVTFHYSGSFEPEEIMKQIKYIMKNYKIPLFNYKFKGVKGNLKLSQFFG